MTDYMDHNHPDAFKDMPVKERRCYGGYTGPKNSGGYPTYVEPKPDNLIECPVCHGHGGWNLQLDAYGPGRHFRASCSQCNGWGWVVKDGPHATCVHEWDGGKKVGNCLHNYTCTKCGYVWQVDSSG